VHLKYSKELYLSIITIWKVWLLSKIIHDTLFNIALVLFQLCRAKVVKDLLTLYQLLLETRIYRFDTGNIQCYRVHQRENASLSVECCVEQTISLDVCSLHMVYVTTIIICLYTRILYCNSQWFQRFLLMDCDVIIE
jgi:hypothetical protein